MIVLTQELVSPYLNEKVIFKGKQNTEKYPKENKFEIGKLYSLQGETCEDFNMPIKTYELIAIIKTLNDITLNSIVVKEVNRNTNDTIFSLTKLDCSLLGVPFQKGLELYPITLNWKKIKENDKSKDKPKEEYDMKYFSSKDLSTYPINKDDKTIKNMIVKVNWVEFCNINGELLKNNDPINIKFKYTDSIIDIFNHNMIIRKNDMINSRIVTKEVTNNPSPYNNIIDLNGDVYFELSFLFKLNNNKYDTIGLIPNLLKDKKLLDIIVIEFNNKSEDNTNPNKENMKAQSMLNNRYIKNKSSLDNLMGQYYNRHYSRYARCNHLNDVFDRINHDMDSIFDEYDININDVFKEFYT